MQEIFMRPDESLEQRIARIDETIMMLKSNNPPYVQVEHLDKLLTDEARLKEKNETIRWKLFELRLVLDSLLVRGQKPVSWRLRKDYDSNPMIPLEVRRLRYG